MWIETKSEGLSSQKEVSQKPLDQSNYGDPNQQAITRIKKEEGEARKREEGDIQQLEKQLNKIPDPDDIQKLLMQVSSGVPVSVIDAMWTPRPDYEAKEKGRYYRYDFTLWYEFNWEPSYFLTKMRYDAITQTFTLFDSLSDHSRFWNQYAIMPSSKPVGINELANTAKEYMTLSKLMANAIKSNPEKNKFYLKETDIFIDIDRWFDKKVTSSWDSKKYNLPNLTRELNSRIWIYE